MMGKVSKNINKNIVRNSSPTKTNLEFLNRSCERSIHIRSNTMTNQLNHISTETRTMKMSDSPIKIVENKSANTQRSASHTRELSKNTLNKKLSKANHSY